MDKVNLSALFRRSGEDDNASVFSTTSETSPQSGQPLDKYSLSLTGKHASGLSSKERSQENTRHSRTVDDELTELCKPHQRQPRARLDGHNDPTNDTQAYKSYWYALFTPTVYMAIFYALRITFLVALPLGLLARHPKVMNVFPAHVVIPLWGIVDCRYTFGEQLATNIASIQCSIMIMLWGSLNNIWNLHDHPAAWWCTVLTCGFVISLFGNVRCKRVVLLHCVLILQMESLPGGTGRMYAVKIGRDYIMSTGFSFFQCLFPVKSIAKDCDVLMAGGWKHIGRIARNCVAACWSDDPIECALALSRIGTEPVQALLSSLPPKFAFITFEFWESTLRLELRRERLTVMEMCMPRLHTMTDAARAIVMKRVQSPQSQRMATDVFEAQRAAHSEGGEEKEEEHSPYEDGEEDAQSSHADDVINLQVREPYADMEGTLKDDKLHNGSGSNAAAAAHHGANGGAGKRSDQVDLARQSNAADLVMARKTEMWQRTSELLKPSVDVYLDALDGVLAGLGKHLNPYETAVKVPFDELREAATDLQAKLDEVHYMVLIDSDVPVDPFLYSNVLVFHLSLIVLAERLLAYGELMQNFDRSRYKSQLQRAWEFFFYDYWKGFWEELPKRLTLATPRDVRIVKDAFKLSCAFAVGCVYTEHIDPENVYYFGMAILMGVGWPTAGDTMEAAVYRLSGMACACSIAYVAIWHTPNLAGELAIALAGVFLALLFRDRPPYAHTSQYCSMLVLTCLTTATSKLELLSRIVSNSFTVMSYYAIVVFIFPIDVLRVTYNAQVQAIVMVTDRFNRLVNVISQPLTPNDPEQYAVMKAEVMSIRAARLPMWMAFNNVGMWLPKAAADPAPLGNPYPLQAMRDMYSSLRRLGSATDVIGASLCALMKSDTPQSRPHLEHVLAAIVPVMRAVEEMSRVVLQDFLDAFSRPWAWSPAVATCHFSAYVRLSRALRHACWTAHRRTVKTLRAYFRKRVMDRTFAAAATSRAVDPDTLERARDISFALPATRPSPPPAAAAEGSGSTGESPSTKASTANAVASPPATEDCDPIEVATPAHHYGGAAAASRPPTVHNASMASRGSAAAAAAAQNGPNDAPAVTNGSIAHTIAESMAIVRSTERRNSRLIRRDDKGGVVENGSGTLRAQSPPAGGNALPAATDAEEAEEQHQTAKDQAEFEKVLNPFERQAQEEERRAFIARRSLDQGSVEQNTLSHDVNMVLTILVGTDMYFTETERLVKTMYAVNEYARSREPAPKLKDGKEAH